MQSHGCPSLGKKPYLGNPSFLLLNGGQHSSDSTQAREGLYPGWFGSATALLGSSASSAMAATRALSFLLLMGLLAIWAGMPPATEAKGICRLPVKVGPCLALIPRWYHEWEARKCKPFKYGGCGGNANNFKTLRECERACGARLPRTPGSGGCPKPQGAGPCVELCSSDGNCGPGEKCCSNGCGHVCMKVTGGAQRG